MNECLFCKIVKKHIPALIIHEDADTVAFLDIHPRAPGHAMVIHKIHSESILDLPDRNVESLFLSVKKVTAIISRALRPDGFTIGVNHGKVSGQAIDHLHIHIIPRFMGDGGKSLHSVVDNAPKESLQEIAEKIKGQI